MSGIRHDGSFDEAALAAMIVAYDLTCNSLPFDATPAAREKIGKQIIEAAKQGERDPHVLLQTALKCSRHQGNVNNMLAV